MTQEQELQKSQDDLRLYLAKPPTANLADFIAWIDKVGAVNLKGMSNHEAFLTGVYAGTGYSRYQTAKNRNLVQPAINPPARAKPRKAAPKKSAPAKATAPKPGPVTPPSMPVDQGEAAAS